MGLLCLISIFFFSRPFAVHRSLLLVLSLLHYLALADQLTLSSFLPLVSHNCFFLLSPNRTVSPLPQFPPSYIHLSLSLFTLSNPQPPLPLLTLYLHPSLSFCPFSCSLLLQLLLHCPFPRAIRSAKIGPINCFMKF